MTELHYERVPAKLSKAAVEYVADHGDSPEQCSKCAHYVNRTTCKIVAGRINPDGWCSRFEGRDHDYADGGSVSYEQPPLKGAAPRNAFKMPHDAVIAMGGGDMARGHAVLSQTVGQHPMSTPIGTVHPDSVRNIGGGSLAQGRAILEKFAGQMRAQRERPFDAATERAGKFSSPGLHFYDRSFLPGSRTRPLPGIDEP